MLSPLLDTPQGASGMYCVLTAGVDSAAQHCLALGSWLYLREPATDFLTDAVAVEAALLGLAIPLSFEIVSRISERYESDIVTHHFVNEKVVVWMPRCLVANITLAILLKFFKGSDPHSLKWRLLAWVGLAGFVVATALLFRFLEVLKRYIINRQFVIDSLLNEARKALR